MYRPGDLVVIKLDSGDDAADMELMRQVADDRELLTMVSEMFCAQAHDAPEVRAASCPGDFSVGLSIGVRMSCNSVQGLCRDVCS